MQRAFQDNELPREQVRSSPQTYFQDTYH